MKEKVVIQVWTHEVTNYTRDDYNHFWGLGDILRGTIKLFQLSQKIGFKLIVDYQLHPISHFLKKQEHEYNSFVIENKNNISFIFGDDCVKNFILESDEDIIFLITNDKYDEPVNESCKEFIKNILIMNDEFYSFFQEKKQEIPFIEYNIIHFRLGDDEIVRNVKDRNYEREQCILNNMREENDILVSDSIEFKKFIQNKENNLFMFDLNIGHFGYHKDFELLKNTLFEFFIITQSKKIKPYSVYSWISGFIKIANEIYDVEIIQ